MTDRYKQSEALLAAAKRVIPLGAQTFSKSVTQLPQGVSPYFASRAEGARFWDVDGNEYLDFVSGLACVLLGYRDEGVDAAVREQLQRGITFSISTELEIEVAEQIVRLIPSAEQVRFGKSGTDATSAAVRLARAVTGRDRIATCGYHGWQDWSMGVTTRDRGIPEVVSGLSHSFPYNDPVALETLLKAHPAQFAAVIMEPMNTEFPRPGYLEMVRELAHAHGALLIFDETVTGLRFHVGGAQALFGVTPDLTTLGKGLANGLPLSAVTGPREYMGGFEDVFFSGTFGGETLSLAAARAVLARVEEDGIPDRLSDLGRVLERGLGALLTENALEEVFGLSGHPSWSFLIVNGTEQTDASQLRTLLLQELFASGVFLLGSHNLSAAHTEADVQHLLDVYEDVLPEVGAAAQEGRVAERLRAPALKPLFRVR